MQKDNCSVMSSTKSKLLGFMRSSHHCCCFILNHVSNRVKQLCTVYMCIFTTSILCNSIWVVSNTAGIPYKPLLVQYGCKVSLKLLRNFKTVVVCKGWFALLWNQKINVSKNKNKKIRKIKLQGAR
jgi:hypothetical protein